MTYLTTKYLTIQEMQDHLSPTDVWFLNFKNVCSYWLNKNIQKVSLSEQEVQFTLKNAILRALKFTVLTQATTSCSFCFCFLTSIIFSKTSPNELTHEIYSNSICEYLRGVSINFIVFTMQSILYFVFCVYTYDCDIENYDT